MTAAATIEKNELRFFASQFATGVAIVTTSDRQGNLCGLTLNSVTSVSLDPPLLLVCLDNESSTLAALNRSNSFCVHYLSAEQQSLSNRFAKKLDNKFADVLHSIGETGCPIIEGVVAFCECNVYGKFPGGDHTIVVGSVNRTSVLGGDPLVFHRGKYVNLPSEIAE